MEESKTCCFFGHRKITGADTLKEKLYEIIEDLIIHNNVDTFLFGSKSDFDKLSLAVVTELKNKYPHIRRVYVRAEYPEINEDYRACLLKSYEETYFPERAIKAGRAVYIERNCEMVDRSCICIVYYKDGYAPPGRKNSSRDLVAYQPKSGTRIAYEYARRKKKVIITVV